VPGLERYCARLARGQARLASDPEAAGAAARGADEAMPGRAAPLVLEARAALALGKLDDAVALFDRGRALETRSVEQPAALYDLATTLRRTGKLRRALDAYRILVPRAAMLSSRAVRALALLEAAHVSMALAAQDDDVAALDEAMAYLREAGRNRHHPNGIDVALSLALTLDRAGRAALADTIVEELVGGNAWAERRATPYLARPGDELALRALALQRHRPRDAARLWRHFLADPQTGGLAKAAAEARMSRLGGSAPSSRRRRSR